MRCTLFVLTALVLTGCTSTRVADPQAPRPYTEVNEAVQGRVVQLHLADGRTLRATDLDVAPDVASYMDADGQMHTVATDRIEQIRLTQHGRGALDGLGVGLLMGGAGGAMIGFGLGSACSEDDLLCDPGFYAAISGALFGALGGLVGGAIGSARGHRTVYRLSTDGQPLAERDTAATAKQKP